MFVKTNSFLLFSALIVSNYEFGNMFYNSFDFF